MSSRRNLCPTKDFRTLFNFKRIERSKKVSDRLDKFDRKKNTLPKIKNYVIA